MIPDVPVTVGSLWLSIKRPQRRYVIRVTKVNGNPDRHVHWEAVDQKPRQAATGWAWIGHWYKKFRPYTEEGA